MLIEHVARALARASVRYAIVGGYAVALHGAVRGTVDIDLVISLDEASFERCESALTQIGLTPRLPVSAREVFHFRKEYIEKRHMVAWSFHDPARPLDVVDILITEDADRIRTIIKQAFGLRLPVASIPDLIAMKRKAGRPQDIEDIRALEALQ